jgi:hypothetical protein
VAVLPERIISDGLPYSDRGVAMVPLRPVVAFLRATTTYHDGLVTIVKNFEGGAARTVTLRLGGRSAQIWDGGASRAVPLARSAESRLGVIFLPAKFLVEILGGQLSVHKDGTLRSVREGQREGVFPALEQHIYRRTDAAKVTVTNRVGKAISLRLNGPQKLRVEIGHGAQLYLQLRPGVYYFQAHSAGMQEINGARRLLAGRKTNWAWGRK